MHRYLILALLPMPAALFAATITPTLSDYGQASGEAYGHSAGATSSCAYSSSYTTNQSCGIGSTGSVPLSYPNNLGGVGTTFSALANSWADSNGLHALAQVSDTGDPIDPAASGCYGGFCGSGGGSADAEAAWNDTLTPVAPAGWSGGPYYVQYSYSLDGGFSYSAGGGVSLAQTIYVEVDADFSIPGAYSHDFILPAAQFGLYQAGGVSDNITTAPIEFTSLQAMPYTLSLYVDADVDCAQYGHPGFVGICSGQATADFSDTLTLTGISFEDANGNAIPGFELTSSSGSDYDSLITSNTSSAPEPQAIWLILCGLPLLARRGKAKKSGGN